MSYAIINKYEDPNKMTPPSYTVERFTRQGISNSGLLSNVEQVRLILKAYRVKQVFHRQVKLKADLVAKDVSNLDINLL